MEIQIAAIQLATAVMALVTAVLALLPALGKAIRHFKRKRPKRKLEAFYSLRGVPTSAHGLPPGTIIHRGKINGNFILRHAMALASVSRPLSPLLLLHRTPRDRASCPGPPIPLQRREDSRHCLRTGWHGIEEPRGQHGDPSKDGAGQ